MIEINGKKFEKYISGQSVKERIGELGLQINSDYSGIEPVIIVVLNGAFVFASDLVRELTIQPKITFVRLKSYSGLSSTGQVSTLIGLSHSLKDKDVLIVEDIVDTGLTMNELMKTVWEQNPASLRVCTLLLKSEVYTNKYLLDYVGFSIPNKFVIGYGLDFDEKGRHLPDIYQAKE